MKKYKPIEVGDVFDKLTVVAQAEDYVRPGNGQREKRYLCRCVCGNDYVTRGTYLNIGKSTSCGCDKKVKLRESKIRNLQGQRFGRLTVIKLSENSAFENKAGAWWECKCDCGNLVTIKGTSLTYGQTTSCGCYRLKKLREDRLIDLSGRRFGKLTVLHRVEDYVSPTNGKRRGRWLCQCDCGKQITTVTSYLTSGNTNSCGCYKRERASQTHFVDIVGERYGMLVVLERVDDYINSENGRARPQFLCLCDCGNKKVIQKESLLNGTISCGCINSRGEREISEYLRSNDIDYEIQYGFSDLSGGLPLKFDFAVFDSNKNLVALIEYQGEQHYEPVAFFGGEKKFDRQQENDNAKRRYCVTRGIRLIEVPYWGKIEDYLSILKSLV